MREALREYDASEQLWEQIAARDPSQKNRLSASAAAGTLAQLKQFFGELESARGLLERSRQTIEEEVARNPGDPRILRRASVHYQLLNGVYLSETRPSLDDAEEAWRWRQKSSAITAQLTAKDPDNADARDLRSADDTGSGYILTFAGTREGGRAAARRRPDAHARVEEGVAERHLLGYARDLRAAVAGVLL